VELRERNALSELDHPALAPVIPLDINREELSPLVGDGTPSVTSERIWNSFFARMMFSLLAISLPFLIIAGLVPNVLSRWGVGAEVVATFLLVAFTGITARLMIRPVITLARVAARVEAGDLSARVLPGGSVEMRHLGQTFNAMLERLTNMLSRLKGEVAESGADLAVAAEQLVAATQEQTSAATQTSSSMEDLSRSTVSIAETAAGVATQAGDVRARIASAQGEVEVAGQRMVALAQQVGEIKGILSLIDDIADQTNLLALNAAIEAARAGESGRGFAVVADEVRRLAERTKAAAAQIDELVKGAQTQSQAGVISVEARAQQMQLWLSMVGTIAEASGKVQIATEEQRSAVERAVFASEHIAEGSRSVASTAQAISLAASRQSDLAADIALSTGDRQTMQRKIDSAA
jgi:methyl-accepting chemotaxis protein